MADTEDRECLSCGHLMNEHPGPDKHGFMRPCKPIYKYTIDLNDAPAKEDCHFDEEGYIDVWNWL